MKPVDSTPSWDRRCAWQKRRNLAGLSAVRGGIFTGLVGEFPQRGVLKAQYRQSEGVEGGPKHEPDEQAERKSGRAIDRKAPQDRRGRIAPDPPIQKSAPPRGTALDTRGRSLTLIAHELLTRATIGAGIAPDRRRARSVLVALRHSRTCALGAGNARR